MEYFNNIEKRKLFMEYQWGKIKDVIKKYVNKAFNENNCHYREDKIDKALVIFNNLITCKSGYALLDGMADKMKPALQRACIDEVGNTGDLNTIMTSLESFMKKILVMSGSAAYNDISTLTFCGLVKKIEIIPNSQLPDYNTIDLDSIKGNVTYIIGAARNARNEVHNSPEMDMADVSSYLRYGFALYILAIITFMPQLESRYPNLSIETRLDFTDDNNGMLLYEYFSFGNESIQLKNRIVNTMIKHLLYEHGDMAFAELKESIIKMSSNSVKEKFLQRRLDELVSKKALCRKNANSTYNLTDNTRKEMQQLSSEFNANSSSFNASLVELLNEYGLADKSETISQKLMNFFSDNFNTGLLDSDEIVNDINGYNNYQQLLEDLVTLGCEDSQKEKLFMRMISLCKENDIVIRISLGNVYSNISDPDRFDNIIRQKNRIVYIDTQILLYSMCVNEDYPTCNEPMFNIAENLINIRDSRNNFILKTQREYVNEACNHLKDAILLIPFVKYKDLQGRRISDNVFYRHYCLLLENDALPDGIDSFSDYLEDNFEVNEDMVNDLDYILRRKIESKIVNELMIDIETNRVITSQDIESSKFIFQEEVINKSLSRSSAAINNDAIMGARLFMQNSDVEPFFLTWDKLFAYYRASYTRRFGITGALTWKLFSPGRFINHLDLLDFKVDTSKISDEILSMIEYADFRQHTLKILDVFNKYFGVAISDKNKRKKYVQMTKEIFSDSNYSNNIESEREEDIDTKLLDIGKMVIKISDHYKDKNKQEDYYNAVSNIKCMKELFDKIKEVYSKNAIAPSVTLFTEIIDKYLNTAAKAMEEVNNKGQGAGS